MASEYDLSGGQGDKPSKQEPTQSRTFFEDEYGNLKFVNFIVRFPAMIFLFMFTLCIGSVFVLSSLVAQEGENPITEDTNAYDIHDIRSISYDSLRLARNQTTNEFSIWKENQNRVVESRNAATTKRPQEDLGDLTYWLYDAETSDGLFTEESLKAMYDTEGTIVRHPDYSDYCYLNYNGTSNVSLGCNPSLSVLNIFYASEWDQTVTEAIIDEFKSDPTKIETYNDLALCVEAKYFCDLVDPKYTAADKLWVEQIHETIMAVMMKWDGQGSLNSNINHVTEFIAYMNELITKRPAVNFYLDSKFSLENQKTMFSRSMMYWGKLLNGTSTTEDSEKKLKTFILENLLESWNEKTAANYSEAVQAYYFMGALIWDIILQILLVDGMKAFASFVAVFFYLRYMLGSWFLTAIGMFEIVLSLPLAWISFSYIFQIKYFSALNTLCIFIVMAIGADDIFVFMDSYKQSASKGPEVLSSLETRMSWVYRRSGSAMLLTTTTTCCAFLCTLISPIAGTRSFGIFAAFVILYDYVLVMTLFCTSVIIYHNRFENKPFCCNCTFWRKCDPTPTEEALEKFERGETVEKDKISKFFQERVGPFMLNARNRIIIGVVLIAWIVVASIYTSQLKPTTSAEQFFDENHPLQIGITILTEQFQRTQEDESTKIHFLWGLNEISRDGVNQLLDHEYVGDASFSSDFVFDESCQTALLSACTALRTDEDLEDFIMRIDGFRSVDCFVDQFGSYSVNPNATCLDTRIGLWRQQDWFVNPSDLDTFMPDFVNSTACGGGVVGDEKIQSYYSDVLGWNGTDLKYVGISVDSAVLSPRGVLAEDTVRVIYDKFIEVAQDLDVTLESACKTKTLMTDLDQKFVFMNNQRLYRTSAVSGSMIGVVFAFVVLFISTRKLHIALFATLCILSVLLGVIGSVTMLGWTLGTIEAILISILAGFSVDYVIHLAHAYYHAEGDVNERVIAAYGDMGISVFSGMLTSVVASIPLFFCTLTFYEKFGTFLCLTIVLSWIFANFGFMCLLASFKISMDRKWL